MDVGMPSTDTPTRPVPVVSEPTPSPRRPRFQLSITQVAASALAAVTATIAASFLGVSGTVIGAAVASIVTVTGNAIYSHSIRRTSERVREVVPLPPRFLLESAETAATPAGPILTDPAAPGRRGMGLRDWRRATLASAAVFVVLLAAITAVELAIGKPISDALRGKKADGTSISQTTGGGNAPAPTTRTVTVTPSVVVTTPTITQTAPPVTTTAPGATTTQTPTATNSPTPPASRSAGTTTPAAGASTTPKGADASATGGSTAASGAGG